MTWRYGWGQADSVVETVIRDETDMSVEVGPYYRGKPDRWYDDVTWLCLENRHVSKFFVKSEIRGDICPRCGGAVRLTYPEHREKAVSA